MVRSRRRRRRPGRAARATTVLVAGLSVALMIGCDGRSPEAASEIPEPPGTHYEPEIRSAFDRAIAAVRETPSARNWALLGATYHAHLEVVAAIPCYRRAVLEGDTNSRTAHLLGLALEEVGDRKGAMASMERAVNLSQASPASLWRLAQWTFEMGDQKTAEAYFARAVATSPDDYLTLQAIAKYLIDSDQFDQALPVLAAMLKARPGDRYASFLAGTALQRIGSDDARAEALLEVGRGSTPQWTDDHQIALSSLTVGPAAELQRLSQRVENGDAAACLPRLRDLAQRLKDDPSYHRIACVAHRSVGDLAEARSSIERARQLAPDDHRVHYQLAGLLRDEWIDSGQGPESPLLLQAMTEIEQVLDLAPTSPTAYGLQAQILEDLGRTEDAYDSWMEADRLDQDGQRFSFYAIQTILRSGDHARAIDLFRVYCDRYPGHFQAWKQLGLTLWRQGDIAEAQQSLSTASRGLPGDPEIREAIEAMSRQ